ncbi:MAG: hypothetical protein C0421_02945 [Hyphomonas sp.]|uniref:phage/plasmid primase, P4 family n=1 Tax=Hyphomonas sp. TaxID=87 RepID=UPI0025BE2FFC|nr:phage/plasmid primase, P4 family [Hyphomonas sp.]MBA4337784.1 hypothetical protein [Hyphomonas sp.]
MIIDTEIQLTLLDLADMRVWMFHKDKRPHTPDGRMGGHTDPANWRTRAEAEAARARHGGDGLGVVLGGEAAPGLALYAVDLDGARDPETGKIAPHAREIVERFASYTEISLSGRGLKILFLAEPGLKGRSFSPGARREVKLMAAGTYTVVTGNLTNASGVSRQVIELIGGDGLTYAAGAASWLVESFGPQYAGKAESSAVDRSREAFALAVKFKRHGKSREEFETAAENDDGPVGDWWRNKADQRQKDRAWELSDHGRDPVDIAGALDDNPVAAAAEAVPMGDIANAHHFATEMRGRLIWIQEQKAWLQFNGSIWQRADARRIMQDHASAKVLKACEAALGSNNTGAELREKEARKLWKSHPSQATALDAAQSMLRVGQDELDTDPWTIGVRNGVLDLSTGKPCAPGLGQYITKQAGTVFDPAARSPLWDALLKRVLPDADMRAFLQRAFGYTLVGVPDEEVMFFVYGPGASGKSTVANVFDAVLGDYAGSLHKDLLTITQHASETERQIVALQGKRLASVNETARGDRFDDAKIKRVVSREKIPARRLYGEAYDFNPTHTIWIRGNYQPGVMDGSDAMWRRLVPIKFGVQIPEAERDPELHTRIIRGELPGVLNWALQGAREWQRIGLAIPAAVEAERAAYRASTDFFGQWLAEHVTDAPRATVAHTDLFESWSRWCATEGVNPGMSNTFAKELSARGYKRSATRTYGRKWEGLRLITGFGDV